MNYETVNGFVIGRFVPGERKHDLASMAVFINTSAAAAAAAITTDAAAVT
jgi:hypothetical protein